MKTAFPLDIREFTNILVAPPQAITNQVVKGGPLWPDWHAPSRFRTFREFAPIDRLPSTSDADPLQTLSDSYLWGGYTTSHFGHYVAEQAPRLLHLRRGHPELSVLILAPYRTNGHVGRVPSFAWSVLDWFNIRKEDVHILTAPTSVASLWASSQGECFRGPGPRPEYLNLLDQHTDEKLGAVPRNGIVYVSRHTIGPTRGGHAGEAYLVSCLEQLGVFCFAPERVPLETQLGVYAGANHLVFAEGSAMHGRQLIGRQEQAIDVLVRRAERRIVESALKPRTDSLRYIDVILGQIRTVKSSGDLKTNTALSIYDVNALLHYWSELGVSLSRVWSQAAFEMQQASDLQTWRSTCLDFPRTDQTASEQQITKDLNALGLTL